MRSTFSRLLAAIILGVGGAMTGLTGFGIAVAEIVVRSGRVPVLPAEERMLHDLAAAAPIVGVLGLVAFVTAIVLPVDASRARSIGIVVSAAGSAVGLALVALALSATGPFASTPSDRVLDGLGIVGTYAAFHVVALIALVLDRRRRRSPERRRLPRSARYVIRPSHRQDVRPVSRQRRRAQHPAMDGLVTVILAISALALLQIAAINLRGEERRSRPRRQIRPTR